MDILITHVRMSGTVRHHSHIERLKGSDPVSRVAYDSTRAEWVKYVSGGGLAHTRDIYGNRAYLRVRQSPSGTWYVQTYADGIPTDNLLELPRF